MPTGTRLTDLVGHAGVTDPHALRAVLLGGYHGSWIPGATLTGARLSRDGLAHLGASPGAGIVHALPTDQCGLARTADILGYLAGESARQCGPLSLTACPNWPGSSTISPTTESTTGLLDEVHRMIDLIDGRGSCRHPDGTARLARSALDTFASDITAHRHGRCEAALTSVHCDRAPTTTHLGSTMRTPSVTSHTPAHRLDALPRTRAVHRTPATPPWPRRLGLPHCPGWFP